MKIGAVSQTVLKRSVLKQLQNDPRLLITPSVEEMCAGIETAGPEQTILTSVSVYGDEKNIGVFALATVINHLASRGADPLGISVHISLPPHAYESRLTAMMEYIERASRAHHITVLCAKAEVNPVIRTAMIYMTGVGTLEKECLRQSNSMKAGQDIVLTRWIGLEGTLRIMGAKDEELKKRFVPTFIQRIQDLNQELFALEELAIAKELRATAMHQITEGGILAALWEIADASHVGVEVELSKMSIKQETIEVCEYYHINPYQLTSAGATLIATNQGEELVDTLTKRGIQASLLGHATYGKERVIINGEEQRYIDRPAPDELIKIYA
ncbi:MAG: AIR synthase-related protein [Lachnospiraceae bacterium]